jgi:hypothetical protein
MARDSGQFSEFLNPKSMLTPGVAGGLTLMITNTLGTWFGAPLGYTALAISAVCGLLVLTAGVPILQRAAYYLLNSLVIFTVAMGSNATGQQIQATRQATSSIFISAAYAQPASNEAQGRVVEGVEAITADQSLSAEQKLDAIQQKLNQAKAAGAIPAPAPEPAQQSQGFFRPWKF